VFHDFFVVQTCIALACVRNLSFYIGFWALLAVGWVSMFLIGPFRKHVDSLISRAYTASQDAANVCSCPCLLPLSIASLEQ
jgi:hypothetical protein